ncbi:hypothetical protein B4N89_17555 [Embleya scabrispora]|uniref:PknH-like extracellular domain-containing protein n=2 Tax=Embleya scabrispora TaxID=159449 RepID=A0A1T3P0I7_9ACTN|nr:hypothetical protein B4N89_17555 [Embleya scabrispora]
MASSDMRHSPENADDEHGADVLDERFRELVVDLAPQVPLPPVAGIHRVVRRRRLRNRVLAGVASLVVVAGGVTLASTGFGGDDAKPTHREQAAVTPSMPPSPAVTSVGPPTTLSETFYPTAQEFPAVAGIYDNWRVVETREAMGEELGPCTSETIAGLGAVQTEERLYRHDGQGGGLVRLVRYPDERTAVAAVADFTGGLAGPCPASNRPNAMADGTLRITALNADGSAWRIQGLVSGEDQYADFGVVRNGPVVAVAQETTIGPAKAPPTDGFLLLVDTLRKRLGKPGSGP